MKVVRRVPKGLKTPIGRHIIIMRRTKEGYFARNVGEHAEYWLAQSLNNFEEVSVLTCKLNLSEFEYLRKAVVISLALDNQQNKSRRAIANKKPSLIRFWYPNKGYIYIWPELIKTRISDKKKPYLYIEVRARCFEKPLIKKGGVAK